MKVLISPLFFGSLFMAAFSVQAQQPAAEDVRMEKASPFKENMIFKPVRTGTDNIELIEVVSLGTPSVKVSNTADGTYSSYDHSIRVTYPLVLSSGKTGYSLCFYGTSEKIPYAVETKGGRTTLFFPMTTHDLLKGRIEQMLTTKKKVPIKITQQADGYSEALLGGF
ncbi:MAG: hypothetical protein FJ340_07975 [Sphingomonadales bacterium]|nr:hypothetical protein [Sphingomonadales bacterium]